MRAIGYTHGYFKRSGGVKLNATPEPQSCVTEENLEHQAKPRASSKTSSIKQNLEHQAKPRAPCKSSFHFANVTASEITVIAYSLFCFFSQVVVTFH
jgi:hypothetical protein